MSTCCLFANGRLFQCIIIEFSTSDYQRGGPVTWRAVEFHGLILALSVVHNLSFLRECL